MISFPEAPWLEEPSRQLGQRLAQGRVPQALLVHGPAGVGRRHLGLALASALLGRDWRPPIDADPDALPPVPHADYLQLGVEEKKSSISVAQVSELIEFLGLTSHQGGRKVGLIYPAEALQRAAADRLLKTLEEPPGLSTLILLCESPARLPATLRSRCERIRLVPPPSEQGMAWLAQVPAPAAARAQALAFSSGGPFAARALLRDGFSELAAGLAEDLQQLLARETPPTAVAKRWAKLDVAMCHRWLYWAAAGLIRRSLLPAGSEPASQDLPLKIAHSRLNMRACFAYLDQLAQARRLESRSLNHDLQFAELLMWWYGGQGASR
jgi:DNA polymerase-3 subunit delta'